ncbi:MAG: metallophosphoesterase [Akkermansiaceae bacterium]
MGKLFTRRRLLRLGVYGSGAAVFGYTCWLEPFWLELVTRKLPIQGLPSELMGKSLVQISDLHVGGRVSSDFLIKSLDRVSELNPDIVVYTGDFVSVDEATETEMAKVFPHLPKGILGTAAILGNHDYGRNWAEESWALKIISELVAENIPVLRNEVLDVSGLQILGLDDSWAEKIDLEKGLGALSSENPAIVLSHNPDTVDQGDWSRFQGWILAGHTHGGQCKPPFLSPPILPVVNKRYTSGHFPLSGGRDLYINRALGYLHQVRFNVRPEITVFELC